MSRSLKRMYDAKRSLLHQDLLLLTNVVLRI